MSYIHQRMRCWCLWLLSMSAICRPVVLPVGLLPSGGHSIHLQAMFAYAHDLIMQTAPQPWTQTPSPTRLQRQPRQGKRPRRQTHRQPRAAPPPRRRPAAGTATRGRRRRTAMTRRGRRRRRRRRSRAATRSPTRRAWCRRRRSSWRCRPSSAGSRWRPPRAPALWS